jgi:hypothetical protein
MPTPAGYEYKVVTRNPDSERLPEFADYNQSYEKFFDDMDKAGWELVTCYNQNTSVTDHVNFVFRRRKEK